MPATAGQPPLEEIDRRIVGALQVNGRASWSRIAEVLDESERTVTRRGTQLLESGRIRVSALAGQNAGVLVRGQCGVGSVRATATALAQRPDCVFAYALSGSVDCVAEIRVGEADLAALVLDELPGTVGLVRADVQPELRTFRSVRQWRPGVLSPAEVAALEVAPFEVQQPDSATPPAWHVTDRALVRALADDGRAGAATLARAAGVSEATARRRLEWMQTNGRLWLRTVVEPADLGFHVEAMLWLRVVPGRLEDLAQDLLTDPRVRWAVAIAGDHDLAVNVAVEDQAALYALITAGTWRERVSDLQVAVVLAAMKRSGVRLPLRPVGV